VDGTGLDLAGRVDLARSASFAPEDDRIVRAVFPSRHVTTDLDGHGTNVASQVSSNGIAFAGVTSRTRLMAVKVCSVFGYCQVSSVLNGVLYATSQGADVINLSLGGGFMKKDCRGCVHVFNRIFHYAAKQGVTVVVAAGNEGADLDHDGNFFNTYCSVSGVICVSATGPTSSGASGDGPFPDPDAPAYYTNYGRSAINVAAPGGNASATGVSWIFSLCSRTKLSYNPAAGTLSLTSCSAFPGSVFISGYQGTSQAAPHVAALAALLVERYGRNPHRIATAIQQSADDLGQPGTDPFYGKGRINVARALGL
jgi:subtilisin family serine protease